MKQTDSPFPRFACRFRVIWQTCALGSLVTLPFDTTFGQAVPQPAATVATAAGGEAPVRLSVFEVTSEKDLGYTASTALTGTRTNEKLENLPNSISVMTHDFLEDLAFNNYFDAVGFATNAENIANDQGTVGAVVGNRGGNQVNIRGLATVRQLRDGFPWYLVTDGFNTERIEFGRGPGGLAYGDVDAGGIINIGSKRATWRHRNEVQVRYDNFGTQRYSLDVNRALVPNRLALRVNAIKSETEQWHQRQGRDLEGYAGALRWQPFKHGRTLIDAAYETGNSTNHLSHLGPTDNRAVYVRGTGTSDLDADPNRPGVQVNGVGMAQLRAAGVTNSWADLNGVVTNWKSTATNVFRVSAVIETAAAVSATDPQNPNRIPLVRVPESIIPLHEDWAGPDNKQNIKYHAYTIELKHSFTERWSGLLAHNGQFDETKRFQVWSNVGGWGTNGRSIFYDVNPVLPNPNGTGTVPNPNYEQLMMYYSPLYNPDGHRMLNWRAQTVYDARLPWGITQRLVLAGAYRHERYYQDNFGYALTREEIARRGFTTGASAFYTNNMLYPIHYLKDGNGDQTLGFKPYPGAGFFRNAAGNGLNRRLDQSLSSGSVNLLGSYFGEKVRTSIGVSREHWLQSASLATRADPVTNEQRFVGVDGTLIPNDGTRKLEDIPVFPFANNWSTNQTYGGVWHVFPWVSLSGAYFESSQFSDNYGLDLQGKAFAPLTGEGRDLGVRFHLPRGIEASVTYFKTRQENVGGALDATVQAELTPLLSKPLVNLNDYRDLTSDGWEFSLTANPRPNWTLTASYARSHVEYTRFYPRLGQLLPEARATAQARGLNPDSATIVTRQWLEDQEGKTGPTTKANASLVTRYAFTEGRLKGLSAGVAARYLKGKPWTNLVVASVEVLPARDTDDYIITSPFFFYVRRIGRFNWRFQLNVNNLLDVRSNQGNSWRWPRYTDPRQFVFTTTVTL
jgi:outer membrane receptor for ferric coprogen and ferric-rhodotorulic acid